MTGEVFPKDTLPQLKGSKVKHQSAELAMTDYGYAAQILNNSARGAMGNSDSTGDLWVLRRFSRVLALALGNKTWKRTHLQLGVTFDEVIDRVKQAQSELRTEEKQVRKLRSTEGDLGITDPTETRSDESAH